MFCVLLQNVSLYTYYKNLSDIMRDTQYNLYLNTVKNETKHMRSDFTRPSKHFTKYCAVK